MKHSTNTLLTNQEHSKSSINIAKTSKSSEAQRNVLQIHNKNNKVCKAKTKTEKQNEGSKTSRAKIAKIKKRANIATTSKSKQKTRRAT